VPLLVGHGDGGIPCISVKAEMRAKRATSKEAGAKVKSDSTCAPYYFLHSLAKNISTRSVLISNNAAWGLILTDDSASSESYDVVPASHSC